MINEFDQIIKAQKKKLVLPYDIASLWNRDNINFYIVTGKSDVKELLFLFFYFFICLRPKSCLEPSKSVKNPPRE